MKITPIFLSVGCFLLAGTVSAQQAYTLDECIEAALQNNVRMKNAENDLQAATHERKHAFTSYFPTISAAGGGFMANKPIIDLELAPGANLSMLKNGVMGGVTASLPLFTGGQIVNGNKLAERNVEKYQILLHQSKYQTELTVENYFWQAVVAQEKLRTIAALENQLGQLMKDVTAAVDAGITTRNDLLQVQLRNNEVLSARLTAENGYRLARRLLAQYIGAEADSIDIAFELNDSLPVRPESLYTQPETALLNTDEYHLLNTDLKAKRIEHRISIGKNLPTVAIGGGYSYNNLMDRDKTSWTGFATVSVPLSGWWGGSHDIKKHKLAIQSAENNLSDQSELLMLRMESTWDDLTNAYRNVEIAQNSIEQSTENLRLNTDYYAAGTCSMSDLLEAQTLYRQSRDQYVEAYAHYQVKKREYLQATGR